VSGLTLGSLLLITFLLHRGYTALTLVTYLMALQLLTCFVFINGSRIILRIKGQAEPAPSAAKARVRSPMGAGGASNAMGAGGAGSDAAAPSVEYVSEASVRALVPLVHTTVNVLFDTVMQLIRCTSNVATLQAVAVLLCLSVLGRLSDGVTTTALLGVAALTLPKVYQMHQAAVDRVLLQARDAVDKVALVLGVKTAKGKA